MVMAVSVSAAITVFTAVAVSGTVAILREARSTHIVENTAKEGVLAAV
jgi:hypothetical protein